MTRVEEKKVHVTWTRDEELVLLYIAKGHFHFPARVTSVQLSKGFQWGAAFIHKFEFKSDSDWRREQSIQNGK